MFPPQTPPAGDPMTPPVEQAVPAEDVEQKKLWKTFRTEIEDFKMYKKSLIRDWQRNIDMRRGKIASSVGDEERINVNMDWSLTKSKEASLYSQTPRVHIDHPPTPQDAKSAWLMAFENKLNDTIVSAGVESVMGENLPDCINAAGFGVSMTYYEAITEPKQVPAIDLTIYGQQADAIMQSGIMPDGSALPMTQVVNVVDKRYMTDRISPADFLAPRSFVGSDFDRSKWIGRTGRKPWSIAQAEFNLPAEQKTKFCGEDSRSNDERLTHDYDRDHTAADREAMVEYDEIFFRDRCYSPDAKSFYSITRLVFVKGKKEPVINEPWGGQRIDPSGKLVAGTHRYPIQVLTLAYLTDEALPPSDSSVGRPQVEELNQFRTHMLMQFKRNMPMRWVDINRIDPEVLLNIMRGEWQTIFPIQGDGSRAMGEVATAKMSQEDYTLNQIAQADLGDIWQLGPNQQGNFGEGRQSATEANVVQSNYQTRIGRDRAKVSKYFIAIAEILGALICLYEDPSAFGEGFDPAFSLSLCYSILQDSTVLIDSKARTEQLKEFINFTGKSGYLVMEPVLREFATLNNLDPNVVIKAPVPPPPTPPQVSIRISGAEDIMNPLLLAQILAGGSPLTPDHIAKAKEFIKLAATPEPGATPLTPPDGMPPMGPDGLPLPPTTDNQGIPLPVPGVPGELPPTEPSPPPQPPPPGSANPDWDTMSKISKRQDYS